MALNPVCQVKDGSGSYVATDNGVNVTSGNTITIKLVDAAGVDTWRPSCVGVDELQAEATVNAGISVDLLTKTATFTAGAAGSAYLFQSYVKNNGSNLTASATFKICVLTANNLRVGATNETTENDAEHGSLGLLNEAIRKLDTIVFSGTQYTLDSGSAALISGDWVCLVAGSSNHLLVTKATSTALTAAGVALGIVTAAYSPGATNVNVGIGGTAPNSVTGLGNTTDSLPHDVYIDATARSAYLYRPHGGEFFAGKASANGRLVIAPKAAVTTSPRHVFNVCAYGLDNTGTVACDTAFAALLTLLNTPGTAKNGGVVFFPKGHYRFDSTVGPIPVGVSLEGEHIGDPIGDGGSGTINGVFLEFYGGGTALQVNNDTVTNSSRYVRLSNLRIRGKMSAASGTANGYFTGGKTKHSASTGPDIRVLIGWDGGGSLSHRSVRVKITNGGARGTATFQYSFDGGTTWNGSDITVPSTPMTTRPGGETAGANPFTIDPRYNHYCYTIPNKGGLSIDFDAGTYVVETYGEWVGNPSPSTINNIGIEFIGGGGFFAENITTQGFRYQISCDGCEGAYFDNIQFQDGGVGAPGIGVDGYQDQGTPLGDDSAFALLCGVTNFSVSATTNVWFTNSQFNNTHYGVWFKEGTALGVSKSNFECTGAWARIHGVNGVVFDSISGGDPQQEASLVFTREAGSTVSFNVTMSNCFANSKRAIAFRDAPGTAPLTTANTVGGLVLLNNSFTTCLASGAIEGSGLASSVTHGGNNVTQHLADTNFGTPHGEPVGHGRVPTASIDIMQQDPNASSFLLRSTFPWSPTLSGNVELVRTYNFLYDKSNGFETFLSSGTGYPSGFRSYGTNCLTTPIGSSTHTVTTALPTDGNLIRTGDIVVTVCANQGVSLGHDARWHFLYRWQQTETTNILSLVGSVPDEYTAVDDDGSYVAPTVTSDGAHSFVFTITEHPTAQANWKIDYEIRGSAR